MSRSINEIVQRKIYAESMGRCMNPNCKEELFKENGDIIEKAHIIPYCETKDNSFENLIVLCPNCHTDFDKNSAFTPNEVKEWKEIRKKEFDKFFSNKYSTFEELSKKVIPLLLENKSIYENYYIGGNKELWDIFEGKILSNNGKLKKILQNNFALIQSHSNETYSNLALVHKFLTHIDEFEATRLEREKNHHVLFPKNINSMFGITPIEDDSLFPSVEALEALITELQNKNQFKSIILGNNNPYILLNEGDKAVKVFLNDTPRLRQLYYDYGCFRKVTVRLDSLNFALKYINSRKIMFDFLQSNNLREISIKNVTMIFIYEYCLSKVYLMQLSPEENTVIVNLHNWNGASCISTEAYETAEKMKITLLTLDDFYGYINELRYK